MIATLNIGDWSDDGHGKNVTYDFETDLSVDEIRKAYFESCEKYNVSLHEEPNSRFWEEDIEPDSKAFVSGKYHHSVSAAGFQEVWKRLRMPDRQIEDRYDVNPDDYALLFEQLVNLARPKAEFRLVPTAERRYINWYNRGDKTPFPEQIGYEYWMD